MYEKKELDEDELNELDFDEAVVFDHRSFCELFWMEIKQRQLIVNTFFVKEKLKPFSIKLIVFIFSLSCYFVINGFLYDTNYVSKRLKRKSKTFYFFIVDSIKRIIYSSIVIAIINLLVGLLFKSDKTLRKAQVKYKDTNIWRLRSLRFRFSCSVAGSTYSSATASSTAGRVGMVCMVGIACDCVLAAPMIVVGWLCTSSICFFSIPISRRMSLTLPRSSKRIL